MKRLCCRRAAPQVPTGSPEVKGQPVVALAGNPNTGKSTLFNTLTGLRQHTGNWPGKTVLVAKGSFTYRGKTYRVVDLPGTYSLLANSQEEEVARDFLCLESPAVTVVVTDATCLERNLNLVLQVLEVTPRVVVCVNLMDEARNKHLEIDVKALSEELGVPAVATAARSGEGIPRLLSLVEKVANGKLKTAPKGVQHTVDAEKGSTGVLPRLDGLEPCAEEEAADQIARAVYTRAEAIARRVVRRQAPVNIRWYDRLDRVLTSRWLGFPVMLLLLGVVFWITLSGANYPSQALAKALFWVEARLTDLFTLAGAPAWLHGVLVLGMYRSMAWVVAVMLPPMAIFFPLFTLLEDFGYLPRVAFNLDRCFKKAGAHGKQALTMCMGFGCNAAGVTSCRIIDSPREKLIAILTNNFVPCNGRFPTLIAVGTLLTGSTAATASGLATATGVVVAVVLVGIAATLLVSWGLSKTILRGVPSSFALELPPYRVPQVGRILVRSFLDRTAFVLARAVVIAAPAGAVTWVLANTTVGGISLLARAAGLLDPFGRALGMDGFIITAFVLGLPANEIVLPILIMGYTSAGYMVELGSLNSLGNLLFHGQGWTWLTALSFMLFSLLHFPCGTTLLTIARETRSAKWTALGALIPLGVASLVLFTLNQAARLVGLV